nr:class I SAM-dependent methyltransferase [Candidatus Burarchaeum sp.]
MESAKERFSRLDEDYLARKATEERFPLEGNTRLAKAIVPHLPSDAKSRTLEIFDIGAAGGALTTLCLLKEFREAGISDVRITLVDLSLEALKATKEWRFSLPIGLLEREYGWSKDFVEFAKGIISAATLVQADFRNLSGAFPSKADICSSGFTLHHMNLLDKLFATASMTQITRRGGIVGIVDECLSYTDYIEWIKRHEGEINSRGEHVPIAVESFIHLQDQLKLLDSSVMPLTSGAEKEFHFFVARKEKSDTFSDLHPTPDKWTRPTIKPLDGEGLAELLDLVPLG